MTVNILFLFQTIYQITEIDIAKDAIAHFLLLLHRYELFGIAADVLKYCPFEDIMGSEGDQSSIRLFCERCGELITNESSKEKLRAEAQQTGNKKIMDKFGYWYCDSCKKKNTSCVLCERPLKKLTMVILPVDTKVTSSAYKNGFSMRMNKNVPAVAPVLHSSRFST